MGPTLLTRQCSTWGILGHGRRLVVVDGSAITEIC